MGFFVGLWEVWFDVWSCEASMFVWLGLAGVAGKGLVQNHVVESHMIRSVECCIRGLAVYKD